MVSSLLIARQFGLEAGRWRLLDPFQPECLVPLRAEVMLREGCDVHEGVCMHMVNTWSGTSASLTCVWEGVNMQDVLTAGEEPPPPPTLCVCVCV